MTSFKRYEHFFNLPLLSDNMTEQSLSFISNLYNYNDLSRARVQNIIDSCSNFVKNSPLNTFITGLIQRLEDLGERSENLYDFRETQDVLSNPFKDLTSEFKRLEAFKSNGTYVPPQKIKIGEREDYRNSEGVTNRVKIPVTIEYISITVTLKNFLELPNIFESIQDYMGSLSDESNILQNVLQGQLWKEKKKSFGDKLVLPLVLYHDDYETNNPLGSHRGLAKTGAVYINIPCLPPNLQSKLENIFVTLLFNSLDEKDFSYQIILHKLLEELKELQTTGLILFEKTPSEKTIFFSLLTVVGDNLAMNAIHGFICSFSGNYCCRFCLIDRSQIKDTYQIDESLLRTQSQYEFQIETKKFDSTGIKSSSCFNYLPGYNVIDSMCVDVMHDILEGVCQYDLEYGDLIMVFSRNVMSH
ncbi:uncharacterized protein LOC141524941 [Cotesia typhae]|uniref:uncharacterized protein LOC141524941 n=1 Tax=Cotesia typhae TaxID=2053667 RepID=UPI003D684002